MVDLGFEPRHSDYRMGVSNYSALNTQINKKMKKPASKQKDLYVPTCQLFACLYSPLIQFYQNRKSFCLSQIQFKGRTWGRFLRYIPKTVSPLASSRSFRFQSIQVSFIISRAPWKHSSSVLGFEWWVILVKCLTPKSPRHCMFSARKSDSWSFAIIFVSILALFSSFLAL